MINSKGEWVYTNAEIANELGVNHATVRAAARRLYCDAKIPNYTINEAKTIAQYLRSIDCEEDGKRLALLHNTLNPGKDGAE